MEVQLHGRLMKNSVSECGCIHTCQGLEFDYVGVIIGDDLQYENGLVITDYLKRAKTDNSLKGLKKMLKIEPDKAKKLADEIIRNTYRTLMTRGQKGCFVYCTDQELAAYFKERFKNSSRLYEENEFYRSYPRIAEDREEY
ncbi:DNA/RNA helicase domain-containing protein [Neobacillus cucumis]|uniref:DNA/RNA helicase domain-containing protein n=1 Tax=Neobacillus cucumis TaxID=1740721 RepID=UPI00203B0AF7|nr:DNA/RNA helicase domain-containing protein [Neobacillus cucumis]